MAVIVSRIENMAALDLKRLSRSVWLIRISEPFADWAP